MQLHASGCIVMPASGNFTAQHCTRLMEPGEVATGPPMAGPLLLAKHAAGTVYVVYCCLPCAVYDA
jgi:hypothetical protein